MRLRRGDDGILKTHWMLAGKDGALKLFGKIVHMPGKHYDCKHEGCIEKVSLHRQCPVNSCALEVGYCNAHGGEDRGFIEMTAHIQAHKDKDTQS